MDLNCIPGGLHGQIITLDKTADTAAIYQETNKETCLTFPAILFTAYN
jgi:hypothetical protein